MIYGIGETVLDILFRDDQPQKAVPGGSTFNAMVSLGRAGCECLMLTQCGDDHVGDLTCDYLRRNGVSTEGLTRVRNMKSHISLAFLDDHSDAHYSFYKDHRAWDVEALMQRVESVAFTPRDVLLMGSYFAVNPLVRPVVSRLLNAAHDAGAFIYYDLNFRQPHAAELPSLLPTLEENIRLSTVVRGSGDDLRVTGLDPAQMQIITDGAGPVRLMGRYTVPTPPITPVSTVGAGDNFNAGFLYEYVRSGLTPDIASWSESDWLRLAARGIAWGQEVCMSFENSIRTVL